MGYFFLILAIVGIIFILVMAFLIAGDNFEERKKLIETYNAHNIYDTFHLHGHPYLKTNDYVQLIVKKNNSIYFYKKDTDTGDEIPLVNLKRYEVKTETEISKDVTLTRLLALGIFAFGAKKTTKTEEQFLILEYEQSGVDITCVFKNSTMENNLKDIVSVINRLKIEENKINEQTTKECAV